MKKTLPVLLILALGLSAAARAAADSAAVGVTYTPVTPAAAPAATDTTEASGPATGARAKSVKPRKAHHRAASSAKLVKRVVKTTVRKAHKPVRHGRSQVRHQTKKTSAKFAPAVTGVETRA